MRKEYAWAAIVSLIMCGLSKADERPQLVRVLVARQYIPAGTVIKDPESLFRWVRYVKEDAPERAVSDFAAVRGMIVARTLAEDQPLKEFDLSTTPPPTRTMFPPGMRAMTMPVDEGAEKCVPNARVDICMTLPLSSSTARREVVLRGIPVLAINRHAADGRPLVTFLVAADQARELIDAQNEGVHRISIRGVR